MVADQIDESPKARDGLKAPLTSRRRTVSNRPDLSGDVKRAATASVSCVTFRSAGTGRPKGLPFLVAASWDSPLAIAARSIPTSLGPYRAGVEELRSGWAHYPYVWSMRTARPPRLWLQEPRPAFPAARWQGPSASL